jgi:membrane protein insertase Oxa1/YidC/SpoIIIJ
VPDEYYIFPLAILILTYWRQNVEGMQTGVLIPLLSAFVYAGLPVGLGIYGATRTILILGVSRISCLLLGWDAAVEER